ncbi:hypothetical protein [Pseudomonas aeruginosa]|uniref:hypothetical protein n=1 Tax=Pseudomonas aeruginosa TaxID=287 RepID=UPI000FC4092B|nr:hypothetical protein [Pseudomonas aeruginosa]MCO2133018.1 hypothetical protein [Pseudomonas aeruginosa]MCO2642719.1 hypothetical protein [Pseudomonas aeruginosa]MCT5592724.1 hypothetical protein [Pseudomonas aeruginosa]RUK24506.1 hypothetical protein IPC245_22640 [Pseudomonas aeruginosa]HCR1292444.1 hypothetical protein [Pseudomonas aeruginosa]
MALITNTNRITPIGLPSGAVILPGASVDVPEWDEIKDRKNLAFYMLTGVLVVEGGEGGDEQGGEEAYRQQLFAELKALGVNAGANSKTETLVSKLAEVKAKATPPADEAAQKEALIEQLATLGVPAGPDASLEELQKALAEKQAEQQ